jgi:hypothetical protein
MPTVPAQTTLTHRAMASSPRCLITSLLAVENTGGSGLPISSTTDDGVRLTITGRREAMSVRERVPTQVVVEVECDGPVRLGTLRLRRRLLCPGDRPASLLRVEKTVFTF